MAQHLDDLKRLTDLTVDQKVVLIEQHQHELERRVALIEALLDAIRAHDESLGDRP